MGNMVKKKFAVDYQGYKAAVEYLDSVGSHPFETDEEWNNPYYRILGTEIVDYANAHYEATVING